MESLENKIGYHFTNRALLDTALSHSSYANERPDTDSNERLEFLGDSVLGMTVADHLYGKAGKMPEGRMTRLRAELVCEQSLVRAARKIGLSEHIMLGHGEAQSGGKTRPSIVADAVEALLAAIYLDGGIESAKAFVERFILDESVEVSDYKTLLQEHVQQNKGQSPIYEIIGEEGPDHLKLFRARVILEGQNLGEGEGRTKKEAEQASAKAALEELGCTPKQA